MFLSSCLKADCPGRATCFTLKHLSRYFYILFSVNWFKEFFVVGILAAYYCFCIKCSTLLSHLSFLFPQSAVSQGLPAGTWHFPNLRQHQFVVLVCPAPLDSALPSYSPIFPVFSTLTLFPQTSQAVQAWHLGSPWADRVFYYVPFSSCSSSPAISALCFCPSVTFLLCPMF